MMPLQLCLGRKAKRGTPVPETSRLRFLNIHRLRTVPQEEKTKVPQEGGDTEEDEN